MPPTHGSIVIRGEQRVAIRTEAEVRYAHGVPGQRKQLFLCACIPNSHDIVKAASGNARAVRISRQRVDRAIMPFEFTFECKGIEIPDTATVSVLGMGCERVGERETRRSRRAALATGRTRRGVWVVC